MIVPLSRIQFLTIPLEWFVGKYVKLGFPAGDAKEHCWVEVTGTKEEELIGRLDNTPVIALDWKGGAILTFNRGEIEEVLED